MPQTLSRWKRLSVHITPERRVEQLPTEFIVKDNMLHCKWCDKALTSLRMDNIRLHITSLLHKDNKLQQGAPLIEDNRGFCILIREFIYNIFHSSSIYLHTSGFQSLCSAKVA